MNHNQTTITMKTLVTITLLLAFGMTESLFGQLSVNLSTGLNYSNVSFENIGISTNGRFAYFFGVAPSYQISNKMRLQTDVQFSQKGYDDGNNNTITLSNRYAYLDIIPEIEFYVLECLALGVGVNYGIKINERFKSEESDWGNPFGLDTVSSTDFGLTGKLKVKHKNIFGFVRYNIGLKNISELMFIDSNGQNFEDVEQTNQNLQIGIGYSLNFRKA